MTKAKGQLRPRILNLRGVKQPKRLTQLCEHIHFKVPVDKRKVGLGMLYAYYPVTKSHPGIMPEYLVRTSNNPVYRLSYDQWMEIALAYIEEVMRMLATTGAKLLLPENCGELQMAKMKRRRIKLDYLKEHIQGKSLEERDSMDWDYIFSQQTHFLYNRYNGYQPVFHWKRTGYPLIRHRQLFRMVIKKKGFEMIYKLWDDDPGAIYNLKSYRKGPGSNYDNHKFRALRNEARKKKQQQ